MHVLSSFQRTGPSSDRLAPAAPIAPRQLYFALGNLSILSKRLVSVNPPPKFSFRGFAVPAATPHPAMLLALSWCGVVETREACPAESCARKSNYMIRQRRCQPPLPGDQSGRPGGRSRQIQKSVLNLTASARGLQAQPFSASAERAPRRAFPPEGHTTRPADPLRWRQLSHH